MHVFSTTKSTNPVSALQLICHRLQNKSKQRKQRSNIILTKKEKAVKVWWTKAKRNYACLVWRLDDITDRRKKNQFSAICTRYLCHSFHSPPCQSTVFVTSKYPIYGCQKFRRETRHQSMHCSISGVGDMFFVLQALVYFTFQYHRKNKGMTCTSLLVFQVDRFLGLIFSLVYLYHLQKFMTKICLGQILHSSTLHLP